MNKDKQFKEDTKYRIYRILHLAKKYSWQLESSDENKLQFSNEHRVIITVYYINLKVITTLKHPKWGRTTLQREGNITERIMELIFRNPRVHIRKDLKVNSSYITK